MAKILLFLTVPILAYKAFANDYEGEIRVYCAYLPKESKNAAPEIQIKSLVSEKLTEKSGQSVKIKALWKAQEKSYAISEAVSQEIFQKCKAFIADSKGEVIDFQASDASKYESLAYKYPLTTIFDDNSETKKILYLDSSEVLAKLNLSPEDEKMLRNEAETWINANKSTISKLAEKIQPAVDLSANILASPYTKTALGVAAALAAAWFAPAIVAGGVELLYPLVYAALYGSVPSKLSLSYWLIYYPGKIHAMTWTYNNTSWILGLGGTALSLMGTKLPDFGLFSKK